jgi:hypothetical protein
MGNCAMFLRQAALIGGEGVLPCFLRAVVANPSLWPVLCTSSTIRRKNSKFYWLETAQLVEILGTTRGPPTEKLWCKGSLM